MKYTPVSFEVNLSCDAGFVFEVGSLFEALCQLHDRRDARGRRYRLVTVLVLVRVMLTRTSLPLLISNTSTLTSVVPPMVSRTAAISSPTRASSWRSSPKTLIVRLPRMPS